MFYCRIAQSSSYTIIKSVHHLTVINKCSIIETHSFKVRLLRVGSAYKELWDPFYWHGLTLIPAWKSNHIHYTWGMELLMYSTLHRREWINNSSHTLPLLGMCLLFYTVIKVNPCLDKEPGTVKARHNGQIDNKCMLLVDCGKISYKELINSLRPSDAYKCR